MKEITLPVSEFKAKCLRHLNDVQTMGDRIVITKRGRPGGARRSHETPFTWYVERQGGH